MQNWIFDFRSRSFVLLVILFLIILVLVYFEVTKRFDDSIILFVSENVGDPTLDIIMQIITESGDPFYMLGFGVIALIVKKTRRIGITLMILIVISTLLTGYIKCGVDRDRPDFDYEGVDFPVQISRDTFAMFCEGGFDASFPSGHAARSIIFGIVLAYALSERFPRWCYLLFAYPILVSISRIYVLQHFPMDVIGGTILGIMLTGVLAYRTKLEKFFDKSKT
ncbi:MAG: phosphatase PAP2 family protein [Nitrosopumilus sp.]|nr:phosphatase PAP2 family protein [Nitrosopumilus sp.]MDH3385484.1 phosphatase PAP2 family protein [Nitrosopumilus sp.]